MRVCERDSAFTFTPFFRRVSIARLESFDRLQKYLLILGLILVILCNFVPKSMRMPLRYAVSH